MVNDKWLEVMPQTTIENLSSVGSDHSPLLMEMTKVIENHIKYFKFLHFWVDNGNFLKTVQQCWEKGVNGNPIWRLHQKMKRITATLSNWSKKEYGDIFTKVKEFEESIRQSEEELMTNNNEDSRQKLHQMNAKYIRYLKIEESILKQKTQLQWFKEGDPNTKYFHALMRGRRRRLFLHKIDNDNEEWIQGEEQIAQAACEYYQQIFQGQNDRIDDRILQNIPTVVTPEQNEMLQAIPTMEELRQVVFSMNPNSAAGPDGIGGKFYQVGWSIIKEDLLAAVQSFFCGNIMPKFMSHACLVLLPKTEQPTKFTDLRPISLSNFSNKIVSKILSMRLATILPLLLSDNQSGFVRGRSIIESIMLAQEITHDRHSLKLIMDRLGEYESTSGQLINKAKSHFMVPDNTAQDIIHTIKEARLLSFGGRITLIKHALQSIPIHTMAALSPPSTTIKYIENIIADFYWGRGQNKRKYHWASLDTMRLPYTEGGVGIRRLSDICTSLQYKQWWNFRSKVSLWSQFLKAKYCQRAHPVAKKVDRGDSLMWKYMMKNKLHVEENIGWKIQSGSCSFWWDDWLGKGALATYNTSISSLNNATIAHFLVNGKWNERKLRQQVPPLLIPSILNTNFQFVQGVKDIAVWRLTKAGEFTCKSAWEMCRKKKATAVLNSQIWHRHIPFKMSFLLWRAIRYKLPTNESLANFGVEPVKCYCCFQQGWDDVEHIFLQGHFAGHIWKFFAGSMGLQLQQHSLHNQLLCWSGVTRKNTAHTMIIHILPIVTCWNLWKNRCSAKYGGKTSKLVACIEKCKQEIRVTLVMWKTPPRTRYKLNTDGTNNQAEVQAASFGLNWCIQHGYTNIILEVDSELLTKWFLQAAIPLWKIHREANGTADLLAKHSHQQDIVQNYYTHYQLPLPVKGSYLLEKLGVQNFRRKKLKRIKQPP
ncbi:hypothetical protein KY284_015135 [Solanum tuberosum]|nr:hypothetical protein KY284_015135 [Solanum tuberosum]